MKENVLFEEKIYELQKDILNKKPLVHNEENTKQALINPFLLLLGYDIHDPNEVELEFKASFSYKKSDKVDYIMNANERACNLAYLVGAKNTIQFLK